jgi:hypothetical protein
MLRAYKQTLVKVITLALALRLAENGLASIAGHWCPNLPKAVILRTTWPDIDFLSSVEVNWLRSSLVQMQQDG